MFSRLLMLVSLISHFDRTNVLYIFKDSTTAHHYRRKKKHWAFVPTKPLHGTVPVCNNQFVIKINEFKGLQARLMTPFAKNSPTRRVFKCLKGTLSRCSTRANLTGFFHRKTIELSLCRIMPTRQSDSWALFYIPFATRVHLSITGRKVNSLN